MDLCAAPRAVNASGLVLFVLFGAFVVGLLTDAAKMRIVYSNDRAEDLLAAHWEAIDRVEADDNPIFEPGPNETEPSQGQVRSSSAAAEGGGAMATPNGWLSGAERWNLQRGEAKRARYHGWVRATTPTPVPVWLNSADGILSGVSLAYL